jgi:hypothetical protein
MLCENKWEFSLLILSKYTYHCEVQQEHFLGDFNLSLYVAMESLVQKEFTQPFTEILNNMCKYSYFYKKEIKSLEFLNIF